MYITESLPCIPETNVRLEINYAAAAAQSLQLCPSLWSPMDCSQPGSSVHGILQARILEGAAVPSSRGSSNLCLLRLLHCRQILYH